MGGPDVGCPSLVVADGARGFHGPIVSLPPSDDAVRLWDAVATLAQLPGVYEVKHGHAGGPSSARILDHARGPAGTRVVDGSARVDEAGRALNAS